MHPPSTRIVPGEDILDVNIYHWFAIPSHQSREQLMKLRGWHGQSAGKSDATEQPSFGRLTVCTAQEVIAG